MTIIYQIEDIPKLPKWPAMVVEGGLVTPALYGQNYPRYEL